MPNRHICIIGAGIAGTSLAIHLGNQGYKVTLVERTPLQHIKQNNAPTRTAAIMNPGIDWLKACGIWDKVKDDCTVMTGLQMSDRTGRSPLTRMFPASDIGQKQFGYNCPLGLMRYALIHKAKAHKQITLLTNQSVTAIEWGQDQAHVSLSDHKKPIACALVIGADGKKSPTRSMASITVTDTLYDEVALTAIVSHDSPHGHVSREYHLPDQLITFVPMGGNQSSIVWVVKKDYGESVTSMSPHEIEERLNTIAQDHYGAITLLSDIDTTPLSSMRVHSLTAPRCALVAEAAHAISPIGAQGLNLSLRDCKKLLQTIQHASQQGLDIGSKSSLSDYNKQRLDITSRVLSVNGLHKTIMQGTPLIHQVKRVGFRFLSDHPWARRFLMRQGMARL